MSEVFKLKARRNLLKARQAKIRIEIDALIRQVKEKLDPYAEVFDLEVEEAKTLIERIAELKSEYISNEKELKKINQDIGE
jgi:hypothetical protein